MVFIYRAFEKPKLVFKSSLVHDDDSTRAIRHRARIKLNLLQIRRSPLVRHTHVENVPAIKAGFAVQPWRVNGLQFHLKGGKIQTNKIKKLGGVEQTDGNDLLPNRLSVQGKLIGAFTLCSYKAAASGQSHKLM